MTQSMANPVPRAAVTTAQAAAAPSAATPRSRVGRPATLKAPKASCAADCQRLEQLPNVGPSLAADLRALGIAHPRELARRDGYELYRALCRKSGKRQDACVLDTFLAITDFMRGAAPAPWWTYTAERKRRYGPL